MKKKSIHKATKNSVIKWDKAVQLVKDLIEKGYPSKVIKLIIKIIDFALLIDKLFNSIKDFFD